MDQILSLNESRGQPWVDDDADFYIQRQEKRDTTLERNRVIICDDLNHGMLYCQDIKLFPPDSTPFRANKCGSSPNSNLPRVLILFIYLEICPYRDGTPRILNTKAMFKHMYIQNKLARSFDLLIRVACMYFCAHTKRNSL